MTKIKMCVVDTVYSLFIYLLIAGFSKEDIFIFSKGIPLSIRSNIPHIYFGYTPSNKGLNHMPSSISNSYKNYKNKLIYSYELVKLNLKLLAITFRKNVEVYGLGHLYFSFPLYEFTNSYLIEDGVGNYNDLKIPFYDYSFKEKLLHFLGIYYRGLYFKNINEGYGTHKNIKKIYLTKDNAPEIIQNKVETINMEELWNSKTDSEKEEILRIFNLDYNSVINIDNDVVLLLTEPISEHYLISYEDEIRIYNEIINEFKDKRIIIKPHPRESKNYSKIFPGIEILEGSFPIEILNLIGFKPKIVASIISTALLNFKDSEIYIYEGVLSSKRLNESRKKLKEMLKN